MSFLASIIVLILAVILLVYNICTCKNKKEIEADLPALVEDIHLSKPCDPTYFCGCSCKVCHENGWDCIKDSW